MPTTPTLRHTAVLALCVVTTLVAAPVRAQQQRHQQRSAAPDTSLPTGTWRGTSLCLVGKPVCKDEIAVYHITPATGADSVTIVANKVVAGREVDMATLHCRFARAAETLLCAMPAGKRPGEWRFVRHGATLVGSLTLADGQRVRAIRVKKR